MGLLWRFMAASPGSQLVAGVAEVFPAPLLLHRRTVTAGGLVAAVTMTNVFALNLFCDVPVKLFSGHLLLAALVLLALSWLLTALVVVQVGLSLRAGLRTLREGRVATRCSPAPLKTRGFNLIQEKPFNR